MVSVRSGQCPNCHEKEFNIVKYAGQEASLRTVDSTMIFVRQVRALYQAGNKTKTQANKLLQAYGIDIILLYMDNPFYQLW